LRLGGLLMLRMDDMNAAGLSRREFLNVMAEPGTSLRFGGFLLSL